MADASGFRLGVGADARRGPGDQVSPSTRPLTDRLACAASAFLDLSKASAAPLLSLLGAGAAAVASAALLRLTSAWRGRRRRRAQSAVVGVRRGSSTADGGSRADDDGALDPTRVVSGLPRGLRVDRAPRRGETVELFVAPARGSPRGAGGEREGSPFVVYELEARTGLRQALLSAARTGVRERAFFVADASGRPQMMVASLQRGGAPRRYVLHRATDSGRHTFVTAAMAINKLSHGGNFGDRGCNRGTVVLVATDEQRSDGSNEGFVISHLLEGTSHLEHATSPVRTYKVDKKTGDVWGGTNAKARAKATSEGHEHSQRAALEAFATGGQALERLHQIRGLAELRLLAGSSKPTVGEGGLSAAYDIVPGASSNLTLREAPGSNAANKAAGLRELMRSNDSIKLREGETIKASEEGVASFIKGGGVAGRVGGVGGKSAHDTIGGAKALAPDGRVVFELGLLRGRLGHHVLRYAEPLDLITAAALAEAAMRAAGGAAQLTRTATLAAREAPS